MTPLIFHVEFSKTQQRLPKNNSGRMLHHLTWLTFAPVSLNPDSNECVHFGPMQVWQQCRVLCSFLTVKERQESWIVHKPFPFCPPCSVSNRYPITRGYFSTLSVASCKHISNTNTLLGHSSRHQMPTFPVPQCFHGCVHYTSIRMREDWAHSYRLEEHPSFITL